MPPAARDSEPPRDPGRFEEIALAVAERGWSLTPDFLPPGIIAELAGELRSAWEEGALRRAGVGRGRGLEVKPEVRSDWVLWIDPDPADGALRRYLGALENVRRAMNQVLYLGLADFEAHFAIYPPGARYRRHLDQFRGLGGRVLTCVLYLNEHWTAADGGALRLYTEDENEYLDIAPHAGRLVTFLSARFFHEVLPSQRERLSITGWLKRREV